MEYLKVLYELNDMILEPRINVETAYRIAKKNSNFKNVNDQLIAKDRLNAKKQEPHQILALMKSMQLNYSYKCVPYLLVIDKRLCAKLHSNVTILTRLEYMKNVLRSKYGIEHNFDNETYPKVETVDHDEERIIIASSKPMDLADGSVLKRLVDKKPKTIANHVSIDEKVKDVIIRGKIKSIVTKYIHHSFDVGQNMVGLHYSKVLGETIEGKREPFTTETMFYLSNFDLEHLFALFLTIMGVRLGGPIKMENPTGIFEFNNIRSRINNKLIQDMIVWKFKPDMLTSDRVKNLINSKTKLDKISNFIEIYISKYETNMERTGSRFDINECIEQLYMDAEVKSSRRVTRTDYISSEDKIVNQSDYYNWLAICLVSSLYNRDSHKVDTQLVVKYDIAEEQTYFLNPGRDVKTMIKMIDDGLATISANNAAKTLLQDLLDRSRNFKDIRSPDLVQRILTLITMIARDARQPYLYSVNDIMDINENVTLLYLKDTDYIGQNIEEVETELFEEVFIADGATMHKVDGQWKVFGRNFSNIVGSITDIRLKIDFNKAAITKERSIPAVHFDMRGMTKLEHYYTVSSEDGNERLFLKSWDSIREWKTTSKIALADLDVNIPQFLIPKLKGYVVYIPITSITDDLDRVMSPLTDQSNIPSLILMKMCINSFINKNNLTIQPETTLHGLLSENANLVRILDVETSENGLVAEMKQTQEMEANIIKFEDTVREIYWAELAPQIQKYIFQKSRRIVGNFTLFSSNDDLDLRFRALNLQTGNRLIFLNDRISSKTILNGNGKIASMVLLNKTRNSMSFSVHLNNVQIISEDNLKEKFSVDNFLRTGSIRLVIIKGDETINEQIIKDVLEIQGLSTVFKRNLKDLLRHGDNEPIVLYDSKGIRKLPFYILLGEYPMDVEKIILYLQSVIKLILYTGKDEVLNKLVTRMYNLMIQIWSTDDLSGTLTRFMKDVIETLRYTTNDKIEKVKKTSNIWQEKVFPMRIKRERVSSPGHPSEVEIIDNEPDDRSTKRPNTASSVMLAWETYQVPVEIKPELMIIDDNEEPVTTNDMTPRPPATTARVRTKRKKDSSVEGRIDDPPMQPIAFRLPSVIVVPDVKDEPVAETVSFVQEFPELVIPGPAENIDEDV